MQNLSVDIYDLLVGTGVFFIGYGVLWGLIYLIYMKTVARQFTKRVIAIDAVTTESSVRDRLLRLFYKKHQVYELSAYMILGIAILVLVFCVYIFIFAGSLVPVPTTSVSENYLLVASLSLRVGIAIIVIFITQVLLRLYRYCLRIGNFYMSRFDALLCCEEKIAIDLETAVALFTPPVDVGREPPSPFEGMWSALREKQGDKAASANK
jgi:hypothetical protein